MELVLLWSILCRRIVLKVGVVNVMLNDNCNVLPSLFLSSSQPGTVPVHYTLQLKFRTCTCRTLGRKKSESIIFCLFFSLFISMHFELKSKFILKIEDCTIPILGTFVLYQIQPGVSMCNRYLLTLIENS